MSVPDRQAELEACLHAQRDAILHAQRIPGQITVEEALAEDGPDCAGRPLRHRAGGIVP